MQSIAEPIRAETETRPGTTKSAAYCIPRALEQRGFPPGNNHTGQVHSLLQLRYGTRRLFRGPNSAEKERWDVICTSTAGLAFQFVSFLTALNNSWGKEKSGLSSRWTLAAVIPQLLIFRARRGFADELMRRFRLGNGRGVKMSLCDLFLWWESNGRVDGDNIKQWKRHNKMHDKATASRTDRSQCLCGRWCDEQSVLALVDCLDAHNCEALADWPPRRLRSFMPLVYSTAVLVDRLIRLDCCRERGSCPD